MAQQMATWYESASPHRQDVLGEYAGHELCAIHGESLLMHCLEEAKVDFQGGFQMLHAIHAVETFLAKLRDRGCNFHVIWFADHEGLLASRSTLDNGNGGSPVEKHARATALSKRRLARAVVMRHLQLYADKITPPKPMSFVFASMDCQEYKDYQALHPLRLFFVSDGQMRASGSETDAEDGSVLTFQSVMYRLNTEGYTVALIDDVEFVSSEARASLFSETSDLPFAKDLWRPAPVPETHMPANIDVGLIYDRVVSEFEKTDADKGTNKSIRESVSMAALAALLEADGSAEMRSRAAAFIVHHIILQHSPLPARPAKPTYPTSADEAELDSLFINRYSDAAQILVGSRQWGSKEVWDAYDLVDGRIWLSVMGGLDAKAVPQGLSADAVRLCRRLATVVGNVGGVDLLCHFTDGASSPSQISLTSTAGADFASEGSVLPFSHRDFDEILSSVSVRTAGPEHSGKASAVAKFTLEVSHSSKKPVAGKVDPKAQARVLRRNQRFMAEIVAYAASLTNAAGKGISPETIVVAPPASSGGSKKAKPKAVVEEAGRQKASKAPKALKGKAGAKNDFKQKLLEQQQALQSSKQADKMAAVSATWGVAHGKLTAEKDLLKQYRATVNYFRSRAVLEPDTAGSDVLLLICSILGRVLASEAGAKIRPDISALVWLQLQEMSKLPLSGDAEKLAEKLAGNLGFPLALTASRASPTSPAQALLSKAAVAEVLKKLRATTFPRPTVESEFELGYCGPYLDRGFDSQADARANDFKPDRWQRRVLDTIDARRSLFVVAPTSAGKTFISFYAMKQVLRESDEGVLVYVAPTKALVNQVAAEIQARFSKAYPNGGGRSVWSIKTGDYTINNPTGCQVLVTVPQMLQSLLLSPGSGRGADSKSSWARRIRWIIFDEVHSIGQSEEGVVWEQLLLMAPCPMIALSATIGNPNEFRAWLDGTEKAKGRDMEMIVHGSRYSDLRSYFWKPATLRAETPFRFTGFGPAPSRWPIPGLEADGCNPDTPFTFVHPMASLMDRGRDSLDDITLEPRDCLTLWRSMQKHQTAAFPLERQLDPAVVFEGKTVAKADAVVWEGQLKAVLLQWMHAPDSPFVAVRDELSASAGMTTTTDTKRYGTKHTLELLSDLRKRGAVPVLIFIYDRGLCEQTVQSVVGQLTAAEQAWKDSSPEWAKTMAEYEEYQRVKAKREAKGDKTKKTKGGGDDDEGKSRLDSMRESGSAESSRWDGFDPEAPQERFSLADHSRLARSELLEHVNSLKWADLPPVFVEGLRRGIGVHHTGMNRRYRQTVEMLFRRGFLTVVVATGTLALGINMPCKTVVFGGDSTELNALNYRQAAGRAGRRGFDILGNIVFYDLRPQRVLELLSSRLPDLRGHFALSTTLVLRTLALLHQTAADGAEAQTYARQCARSLFAQTHIYLGGATAEAAIGHHLRFSIEFLRRQDLLSAAGVPLNLAGLVGNLYFAENGAFALHALLRDGYLHRLCGGLERDVEGTLLTLVLVLAHLFGRHPCRRHADREWLEHTVRPSASVVLLPALPAEAEAVLRAHNAAALAVFQTYGQSYVRQHLAAQPDDLLPLTGQRVGADETLDVGAPLAVQRPVQLRSPFAALSGFTDEFASVHGLCSSARAGLFLEESAIPYVPIAPADTDGVPLNAYLYDFFRHGDMAVLVKANGIKDGDVWYYLRDFARVLTTVVSSLKSLADPLADMDDNDDGDDLSGDDEDRPRVAPSLSSDGTKTLVGSTVSSVVTGLTKPKRKVVVDSWDDEDDEDDEDQETVVDEGDAAAGADLSAEALKTVIAAFSLLKERFDEKFQKVWA